MDLQLYRIDDQNYLVDFRVEGDTSREKAACCCRWKAAEAAFEGDRRIGR
jgi:hypothetical protein